MSLFSSYPMYIFKIVVHRLPHRTNSQIATFAIPINIFAVLVPERHM